ncbi:hypothetical protein CUN60_12595 [Aquella oligotrophica]|uniref:Uncharacterized protein n=1 Tax=Aquella oligotrophica TaxID=2067065 RepID=A0A2I7N9I5_9NEIS|nr:hypothetical protein CUN60_12595 [Aquella oligotrophica]
MLPYLTPKKVIVTIKINLTIAIWEYKRGFQELFIIFLQIKKPLHAESGFILPYKLVFRTA